MRLVFTLIELEHIIWPSDPWSRKHMIRLCDINDWTYSLVPTTMGTEAFKFDSITYKTALKFFQHYEVD